MCQGGSEERGPSVVSMLVRLTTLALLLAACGGAADGPSATSTPDTEPTTVTSTSTTVTATPTGMDLVVYYMMDGGGTRTRPGPFLVPVRRTVEETTGPAQRALEVLLEGPTEEETRAGVSSAIPDGTRLLGVSVDDGLAVVDLSGDFEVGGGTFSQRARLAQLVYTVTRLPTVDRVELRLDGRRVDVFSSEGIVIDGPSSREDFSDFLPIILVEDPPYGGSLGSRAHVSGVAAVFEATFHLAVLDGSGNVLVEPPYVMTDNGAGWGSFDVALDLPITTAEWGTLRVWNYSAEDGSVEALREYPVWLVPGD